MIVIHNDQTCAHPPVVVVVVVVVLEGFLPFYIYYCQWLCLPKYGRVLLGKIGKHGSAHNLLVWLIVCELCLKSGAQGTLVPSRQPGDTNLFPTWLILDLTRVLSERFKDRLI
jgi:hypothetical protein